MSCKLSYTCTVHSTLRGFLDLASKKQSLISYTLRGFTEHNLSRIRQIVNAENKTTKIVSFRTEMLIFNGFNAIIRSFIT